MLKGIFNKSALRRVIALTGLLFASWGAAISGAMAQQNSPLLGNQYTFKNDEERERGVVEFRACGQDICLYAKEAAPETRRDLNIPDGANDHMIVYRLRANGQGLSDGILYNPKSSIQNGASVNVTPTAQAGRYKIRVSKLGLGESGWLERR